MVLTDMIKGNTMVMFVESTIVVNGNDNDIQDFLNYMFSDQYGNRDNDLIFIKDKNERIEVSEDKFSNFTECDWKYRNWFTKWNFYKISIDFYTVFSSLEYISIKITNNTKFPPETLFDDFKKFPKLNFLVGIGFEMEFYKKSIFRFKNGNTLNQCCLEEYSEDDDDDGHYYLNVEDGDGNSKMIRKLPVKYVDDFVKDVKNDKVLEGSLILLGYKLRDNVIY